MFEGLRSAIVGYFGIRILKGATLLCAVFLIMMCSLHYFRDYGETVASKLTSQMIPPLPPEMTSQMQVVPPIGGLKKVRLIEQFRYLERLKRHHFMALRVFYANQFVCISMALTAGLFATACLAFITRDGWGRTSGWIQAAFIIFASLAVYYATLPKLFRQEENVSENKQLFVTYSNLQQEILTLFRIGCSPPEDTKKECLALFIENVDARVQAVNRIAIGFDSGGLSKESIPLAEALAGK